HDPNTTTRQQKERKGSRDMGKFLSILRKGCKEKKSLQRGTSKVYYTLWSDMGVQQTKAKLTTVELSSERVGEALVNFEKANLLQRIDIHNQEAGAFLDSQLNHSFDFIFLDSERTQYMWWFEHIKRMLQPKGFLVVDNATSHASELGEFIKMIEEDDTFETVLLAFQKGAFVARKNK
ncbi:class I SAM-dependent methyltransferase, partial [Bacillus thuringiensis]|uniref:O-methyltransferase n=1 Tax=Bacillus thuringiensis TaxID=1428 RepID=UPI002DB9303E